MIDYIFIDNFKSLKEVGVGLPNLAYFCGPNGSGKSNFAEALDFVSQVFRNGLSYAVADKGGFYNMCFRKQRRSRGAITFRVGGRMDLPSSPLQIAWVRYWVEFALQTKEEKIRSEFYVSTERYVFQLAESEAGVISNFTISREGDRYVATRSLTPTLEAKLTWVSLLDEWFREAVRPVERELLFPGRIADFFPLNVLSSGPGGMRVFRINPRSARQPGTPSVSGELGKFGENLPSALDYAMQDQKAFAQLQSWVKGVVPSLSYLKTDYTETKQLGLFLQEEGVGAEWYAEDLSDGTVMSIALFLAVLDERHSCTFIEEPENSLHPWILRGFLDCAKEVSRTRQVMISTQSPVVVATAEPENLFLVEKREGRTHIENAFTREPLLPEIINKDFLNLGEYWLSGGLRAVPEPPILNQEALFHEK